MAQKIRRTHGDTKPLGNKWVTQFKKRHPEVSSSLGRRIEKSKKRAVPDQEPVKIVSREDVLGLMRLEKLGEKTEEASEAISSAS